jgi:hypothetical protein
MRLALGLSDIKQDTPDLAGLKSEVWISRRSAIDCPMRKPEWSKPNTPIGS